MALFGKKKEEKKAPVAEKAPAVSKSTPKSDAPAAQVVLTKDVLRAPRITEKASVMGEEGGVYVFNVAKDANKIEIAQAVEEQFKVKPAKVRVANYKAKKRFVKGKWGASASGKKAYIYLKKGDSIHIA